MARFYPYQRLPTELKLKIWDEATLTTCGNGVHHFTFSPDNPEKINQMLGVKPRQSAADTSNWVERRNMASQIDAAAARTISSWEAKNQLWIAPFKKNDEKGDEHNNRGKVNCTDDMVMVYMADTWSSFYMLDVRRNQERFHGLEIVGVPYNGKRCWTQCFNPSCLDATAKFCSVELGRFLGVFRSLKQFYFVCHLTANKIVQAHHSAGQMRLPGNKKAAKQAKKPARVVIKETLAKISAAGGRVWRDKTKVYYEVVAEEHQEMLVDGKEMNRIISCMMQSWTKAAQHHYTPAWNSVTAGIVVCVSRTMEC